LEFNRRPGTLFFRYRLVDGKETSVSDSTVGIEKDKDGNFRAESVQAVAVKMYQKSVANVQDYKMLVGV
jgi:hypothetical protein